MIIVKTTNGDVFLNEREFFDIEHLKEKCEVRTLQRLAHSVLPGEHVIKNVEQVRYVSDATPLDYKDHGSKVEKLSVLSRNCLAFIELLKKDLEDFSLLYEEARFIISFLNENPTPEEMERRKIAKDISRWCEDEKAVAPAFSKRFEEENKLRNELRALQKTLGINNEDEVPKSDEG